MPKVLAWATVAARVSGFNALGAGGNHLVLKLVYCKQILHTADEPHDTIFPLRIDNVLPKNLIPLLMSLHIYNFFVA